LIVSFKLLEYSLFNLFHNYKNYNNIIFIIKNKNINIKNKLGIGDWGLGIGDWGLGPIPNPQSPIPNPPSPFFNNCLLKILLIFYI